MNDLDHSIKGTVVAQRSSVNEIALQGVDEPEHGTFIDRWQGPIALSGALFIAAFNIVVLQMTMPVLIDEFDSTVGFVQATLVVLSLVTMAFIPTNDNLSQRFGRKRTLAIGLVIHLFGTVLCAGSRNIVGFSLSYAFLLGIAATSLVSMPWALLHERYPQDRRQRIQLILTIGALLGVPAAQALGGVFVTGPGWRWSFVFQAIFVLVLLRLLRREGETELQKDVEIDWLGGSLALLGLGTFLTGLSFGPSYGWFFPIRPFEVLGIVIQPLSLSITPFLLAAGVIQLGVFVFYQRQRHRRGWPLMFRGGLLTRRQFVICVLTGMLFSVVLSGFTFDLYLFVPYVLQADGIQTALTLLPMSLAVVFASIIALRPSERIPSKRIVQSGLIFMVVGFVGVLTVLDLNVSAERLRPFLIVIGLGTGQVTAAIVVLSLSLVQAREIGEASGIFDTFGKLGDALGRSVMGALLVSTASVAIVDGVLQSVGASVTPERRQRIIVQFEEAVITLNRAQFQAAVSELPQPVQNALSAMGHGPAITGMRVAVLGCTVLALFAVFVSLFLPGAGQAARQESG